MTYNTCVTLKHAKITSKLKPNLAMFQPYTKILKFSMVIMAPTDLTTIFFLSRQIFMHSEYFCTKLNFQFCFHTKNRYGPNTDALGLLAPTGQPLDRSSPSSNSTFLLSCCMCVPNLVKIGSAVRALSCRLTDGQTDRRMTWLHKP